jgi:polysaccharide biosynthesis/export protein
MTNSKRLVRCPILCMLTASLLAGQQVPPSAPAIENGAEYLLGPGDQIKVWALGVEEITDKPIRVDPSGDIDLPLVGKVHAAGSTTAQLKAELIQRLSKDLLKPQVSVELVDFGSQPVSVLGAVNHPGVHQLQGRKTLMEVISLADGLRPESGPRVNISRQIQYGSIPLPSAQPDPTGKFSVASVGVKDLLAGTHPMENILIYPNDVVTVPPAEAVFVIGAVHKPGEQPLKGDGVTVLQALSSAEGFGPTPAGQNARILRLVSGSSERQQIPIDLNKILAGKAEDVAMRPFDVLVVPTSAPKKFAERALEAAIQAATGAAMYGRF